MISGKSMIAMLGISIGISTAGAAQAQVVESRVTYNFTITSSESIGETNDTRFVTVRVNTKDIVDMIRDDEGIADEDSVSIFVVRDIDEEGEGTTTSILDDQIAVVVEGEQLEGNQILGELREAIIGTVSAERQDEEDETTSRKNVQVASFDVSAGGDISISAAVNSVINSTEALKNLGGEAGTQLVFTNRRETVDGTGSVDLGDDEGEGLISGAISTTSEKLSTLDWDEPIIEP
jgi:hypothetical protein